MKKLSWLCVNFVKSAVVLETLSPLGLAIAEPLSKTVAANPWKPIT